jgi:malonate-semialdehyde dehydrogenase (acetylating) / methylmalonate-semialdehyde dehydrogenase
MKNIPHFINGQLDDGDGHRVGPVFNPSMGVQTANCRYADQSTLNRTVEIAKKASLAWGSSSHAARQAVIFKFRELVIANYDHFAEIIGQENGKTIADAKGEIGRAIEAIEFAAGAPHITKGEYATNVGGGIDVFSMRVPLGIVGCITPFNFPVMVPVVMFAMAISVGNAIVWKPSEKVPTAGLELARLFKEAGLPDGVFNVLNGDKELVDAILEHLQSQQLVLLVLHE